MLVAAPGRVPCTLTRGAKARHLRRLEGHAASEPSKISVPVTRLALGSVWQTTAPPLLAERHVTTRWTEAPSCTLEELNRETLRSCEFLSPQR